VTPILLVSVDTEEEFDWSGPFSATQRSVGHVARLPRLHELFERCGVRPTYLIDHPIAASSDSVRVLDRLLQRDNCEIGAHLHPWVNPPLVEEVNTRNSYLCNLPLSLQQDKIAELTRTIALAFGIPPAVFKAGRYGLDFTLVPTLGELGYSIDSSIMAYGDFTEDEGPWWERYGPAPFWLTPPLVRQVAGREPLLEIPCTSGFIRRPFRWWAWVRRIVRRKPWSSLRLGGILWHLALLRRVVLTPEGPARPDLLRLMRALAKSRAPVLNLTLHSPSIEPGHTPYVRSEEDLEEFFDLLACMLEFAVGSLGARCLTLSEYNSWRRSSEDEVSGNGSGGFHRFAPVRGPAGSRA
jgi:hypothetical protein